MTIKLSHDELYKLGLKRPGFKEAYDALDEEFELLEEMLKARKKAGKTQADIAKAMKTSTSAVGRLESSGGKTKHSPTLITLRKYANALGYKLSIKFVPLKPADKKK